MGNDVLALDCETSYQHSSPYDLTNKPLVCYSIADADIHEAYQWNPDFGPTDIEHLFKKYKLILFFNGKFDVAWLRKSGISFEGVKVWDVQVAEFILSRQLKKFPSLRETAIKYGLSPKLDVVKTEYWEKGIDTDAVPWEVLREYAAHDSLLTLQCYEAQLPLLTPAQRMLVSLMSQDMLVLQEMEQNGITFDESLCEAKALELNDEISKIEERLASYYPGVPINFNSPHMLSAFLYGGQIVEIVKEHDGFFKTGLRVGQPRYRNKEVVHTLPRLFIPVKGSEMSAEGVYGTNEGLMRKIKPIDKKHKPLIDMLLQLAKLDKLRGTYYVGLPKLNKEQNWPQGKLHGTLNQTLAVSGRLSSSKPNQQNFASELQDIFISDFA